MFRKPNKKRTFFEKLTGSVPADDFYDFNDEDDNPIENKRRTISLEDEDNDIEDNSILEEEIDGQLSVDVINTDDAIIIKSMLAGVKPNDIDIDISRDMVTIRGEREESHEVEENDYYHKELYWGGFSRNILLPEEVDVDASEASEKHGLLTLRLPKLDKSRKAKLHVKSK